MRQIAFYGKGGIGKSTTTANISGALSRMGYKVMQIGCDPKADSTKSLTNGKRINTILDILRDNNGLGGNGGRRKHKLEDFVYEGYNGVFCCEAGGPEPGVGCAGRGVITAIQILKDFGAFEIYKPDIVLYDVLGDVVCGGFAMPIREGFAKEIYIITSGELMSIYACNNIFKGISKFSKNGLSRVGGIVLNSRNTLREKDILRDFSQKTSTELFHMIPRDRIVHKCEMAGKTVIEAEPNSRQAEIYRELARKLLHNTARYIPTPMDSSDFYEWLKEKEYFLN